MASGHAFNSLGQIFAAGGDTALILDASVGILPIVIAQRISERFPRLSADEQSQLLDHVTQAANIGGSVATDSIERDSPLVVRLDEVPLNRELFGDEPGGRRIRVTATLQAGEQAVEIMAKLDFATMPNLDELFEAVREFIERMIDEYPDAAERLGMEQTEEIALDIAGIQRSY